MNNVLISLNMEIQYHRVVLITIFFYTLETICCDIFTMIFRFPKFSALICGMISYFIIMNRDNREIIFTRKSGNSYYFRLPNFEEVS